MLIPIIELCWVESISPHSPMNSTMLCPDNPIHVFERCLFSATACTMKDVLCHHPTNLASSTIFSNALMQSVSFQLFLQKNLLSPDSVILGIILKIILMNFGEVIVPGDIRSYLYNRKDWSTYLVGIVIS